MSKINSFFLHLCFCISLCVPAQSFGTTISDEPVVFFDKSKIVNNTSKDFFDVNLSELEAEIQSLNKPVESKEAEKIIVESNTVKITEKVSEKSEVISSESIQADLSLSDKTNSLSVIKKPVEILNLPALDNYAEHNLNLDRENFVTDKKEKGNVSSDSMVKVKKCTSELPCIPMYNKYMLNLDKEDPTLSKVTTRASEKLEKNLIANKVVPNSNGVLPEIPLLPSLKTEQNVSYTFKSKKELENERIARIEAENLSETDLMIRNWKEKGIILAVDTHNDTEYRTNEEQALAKITSDLENADIDELIKRKEHLYKLMGVTGQFLRDYSEAKDKVEFVKNVGISKVNGVVDSHLKKFLEAYNGVNAQINARIKIDDKSNFSFDPEGKILFPLYSVPKNLVYTQGGLTKGTRNRTIAHLAVGDRFYPQATSMTDLGNHMIGTNFVIDRDLERKHLRGSVGLEYMYNNVKLVTNIYRRLSGWRDSPDFENGYVEERAASGWDMFVEYWLHSKFALKAGLTHWMGKDISPFGDIDPNKLEDSPYIYSIGAKYNPYPALGFEANYQRTGSNQNKQFYFGVNFNLPLGGYELADAFNADAVNKSAGNMILSSRTMFIDRDYTMPLQYRSKPNKYYIYFVKALGNNRYLFKVEDGFHRPAENLPVHVEPSHPSVELSNGGNYVTDSNGNFIVEIIHSAIREVTLTVIAGETEKNFDVVVDKLDWKLKAVPETIERYETSTVTLYIESDAIDALIGTEVKWRLGNQIGELNNADLIIQSDGTAKVIYTPDSSKTEAYDIEVIATVFGVDFSQTVHVVIYGNGADDLTASSYNIDGGDYATVTYKNLKPNSVVQFTAVGVGQIFADEPQGTQDMTGTDSNGVSVDITVNEDGIATAYVVGSTVVGDTGNIVVSTKTPDPYFDSVAPKITIRSNVYDGLWSLPSIVQYLEPFDATLTSLKDGTQVTFSIDNETASFSSLLMSSARLLLASSPNDINATRTVTVADKKATTKYLVTGDYSFTQVNGIHAKYYHDAYNTQTDTEASVLSIQQYTPYFIIDSENQDILDWFSGEDEFTVTLTGGQPYRVLTVHNPSSNVTITAPETFDSAGNAEITIKGNDVRSETAFTVNASAMGKTPDLSDAVSNGILTYHVYEPVIHTSQGVSGENITDTTLRSGAPAFKGESNTGDYKTDYEIEFSGLLRNSPVTFSCDNSTLSTTNATTDSEGKVKVTVYGVDDYSIKSVTVSVGYQVNSVASSVTTKDFTFNLYQYTLSISASSDTIVADGTSVVTVTGGRANEPVEWSLTGSGKYTAKADSFDGTGTAKATVQGVTPFTGTIKVNLTQLVICIIQKTIIVKDHYSVTYTFSTNGGTSDSYGKNRNYYSVKSNVLNQIQSVVIYANNNNFDDIGYLYLNNVYVTFGSSDFRRYVNDTRTLSSSQIKSLNDSLTNGNLTIQVYWENSISAHGENGNFTVVLNY